MSPSPRHLLHVFSTFCAAGPQVRTAMLMRALGDRYRHTVVSCDGRNEAAELAPGVDLRLVAWAPGGGAAAGIKFARSLLREQKPDLLLTYNWGAMDSVLAARSSGFKRLVHHEDGFNADESVTLKGRRNWTRRLALRSTDVIVPSANLERIAKGTWRLRKVQLIPNGLDASLFARSTAQGAAFRTAHGICENAFVVGAVGHLRPVKNFGRLIHAMAQAAGSSQWPAGQRPHLLIVGEGGERAALEAEAAKAAHLDVTFTGHISGLASAYSAMDVFALSSNSEQQPVSLLEAMSASCPVVATDVGDISATLPEEGRRLISELGGGVEEAMAASITELAGDKGLRDRLAELGLERVKKSYSLPAMVDAYGAAFDRTMNR